MADTKQDINNIPELQSPFEQLKEVDVMARNGGTHASWRG